MICIYYYLSLVTLKTQGIAKNLKGLGSSAIFMPGFFPDCHCERKEARKGQCGSC